MRLAQSVAAAATPPTSLGTFLAWKALATIAGGGEWMEGWRGNCCPTCGALPAMAQLRESERGRERALACGLCGTLHLDAACAERGLRRGGPSLYEL